jgi:hypothetical protein
VVAVGCATDPPAAPKAGPLALATGWAVDPAGATDPFPAHRPALVDCAPFGVHPEAEALEVETQYCNYFVATQALMADVDAGDDLALSLWHLQLTAPEVAVGHVALAIGPDVVWETEVAIPNSPKIHNERIALPAGAAAGTPVTLHLHNHGFNAWYFADVEFAGVNP